MEITSINELKKELQTMDAKHILETCLKLAKGNKQSKELLHFLLFEAQDISNYILKAKEEINFSLSSMPHNFYMAKKHLRKTLKEINKYIKYAANPKVDIELLLHFLSACKDAKLNFNAHPLITNMMISQIKKIKKAILKLHEDLQYDYSIQLENVLESINLNYPFV